MKTQTISKDELKYKGMKTSTENLTQDEFKRMDVRGYELIISAGELIFSRPNSSLN